MKEGIKHNFNKNNFLNHKNGYTYVGTYGFVLIKTKQVPKRILKKMQAPFQRNSHKVSDYLIVYAKPPNGLHSIATTI